MHDRCSTLTYLNACGEDKESDDVDQQRRINDEFYQRAEKELIDKYTGKYVVIACGKVAAADEPLKRR
nr:hypothetical protein [Candidatus Njordarchaeota archaeon]